MRSPLTLVFLIFTFFQALAQQNIRLATWNLQHFGSSKHDSTVAFIAGTLRTFDVIALQEVVGKTGPAAVHRLINTLNTGQAGNPWKASVSPVTTGSPSESDRYAFIWNSRTVSAVGTPQLESRYADLIVREPYTASFSARGFNFTVVNFHAVPKTRQPESEIKYLKEFPARYASQRLVFLGDFNVPQTNTVFNPLKSQGYRPALKKQKTSLKMKCVNNDCLASEYDNIFYSAAHFKVLRSGVVHFYRAFPDLTAARKVSDHIPVFIEFAIP